MSRNVICFISFCLLLIGISCETGNRERFYHFTGNVQGTTYSIKVMTDNPSKMKEGIDSIFSSIDSIFSTYHENSEISKINNSRLKQISISPWMEYIFNQSLTIYKNSNGFFDPTIISLSEYWDKNDAYNSHKIDSIKKFIGMDKVSISDGVLYKKDDRIRFSFNAIVPGFTSDIIGDYFYKNGYINYLVEVGGEVSARGRNQSNKAWVVGIDRPDTTDVNAEKRVLINTISLDNQSLATSGNYRKWKSTGEGSMLGHIINPHTCDSQVTDVSSVTVVAQDCIVADSYATAFVAMGFDKSKVFLNNNQSLQAYFIVADTSGNLIEWETKKGLVNMQILE